MEFSVLLFISSFLAGILTVFAPCIFTFLPVVLGSSNVPSESKDNKLKAITVILSLALSVFTFSLLLKASTVLIQIPQSTWDIIAGSIILIQGLIILLPTIWDKVSVKLGLFRTSNVLNTTNKYNGRWGDILTGAALGPIFSSCSPTYGFIVGALIQSTFSFSLIYLVVYIFGLSLMLFLIAILGQRLIQKLKWGINPKGLFKRVIAVIFIVLGILIITGFYKDIETFIINYLPFLDVTRVDRMILQEVVK